MKHILATFVIGVFTLFLSAQANAEHHTAQAMEHAGMAQAHGEDGHAKVLLQHAKEALKHAKEADKVHADAAIKENPARRCSAENCLNAKSSVMMMMTDDDDD